MNWIPAAGAGVLNAPWSDAKALVPAENVAPTLKIHLQAVIARRVNVLYG